MKPIDPSDAHLQDRILEIRIIKSAVLVFLLSVAIVFYSWVPILLLFALGYVAYRFRYFSNRVGVYTRDDLSLRHQRLELGLVAFGVAAVATFAATEAAFGEEGELGGFLSLPVVDFTDYEVYLQEPELVLPWLVVAAPAVVISYVGLQFRQRLLEGVDTDSAALRATIWESLARIPIFVLWAALLTLGPVYEVWKPVVDELGGALDLTVPEATGAVVFGDVFPLIFLGSLAFPVLVVGAYVAVQRWKYQNATVPELFGYRGASARSMESHEANLAVPVGVFLLYTGAMIAAAGSVSIVLDWATEIPLVIAIVVAAAVGTDILGKTTIHASSVSQRLTEDLDAVVIGFTVGLVVLLGLVPVLGTDAALGEVALAYPVLALPLAFVGNMLAGRWAVDEITEYREQVEEDPDAFDEEMADLLFVYSGARDDTLRATAIDGLASTMKVSPYRKDEALEVFQKAIRSPDEDIGRSGLGGLAAILSYDASPETYEQLVETRNMAERIIVDLDAETYERLSTTDTPEWLRSYLGSEDRESQMLAAETAARLFKAEIEEGRASPADHIHSEQVDQMRRIVEENPDNVVLADAVVEYFATAWYWLVESEFEGADPNDPDVQGLLGHLISLSPYAYGQARLAATLAVTGGRAVADEQRFSVATSHLHDERDEVRYLSTHVVRSSVDRYADRVETDQLLVLLDDPSAAVQHAGAETIAAFVTFAPARAADLLDRLVLYLEDHRNRPGPTEGAIIRALDNIDAKQILAHPNAAATVADYVGVPTPQVARPAARVLSSLVEESPNVVTQSEVSAAVEAGLTHPDSDVRLHCLEATVVIVDDSIQAGRPFVEGLAESLGTSGRHGELASVCLTRVLDEYPEDGLDIIPQLATGLRNMASVDRQSVPFLVRGSTVSAVTVHIVEDVIPLDTSKGDVLIDPLVDLITTAEGMTLGGIFAILAELSSEFPEEATRAVEVAAAATTRGRVRIRYNALQVLANVTAHNPEAVEPHLDRLLLATEDDNPRVRGQALVALTNVCTAMPTAIESNFHRVVGCLEDDSAAVREQAAHLVITLAEREPELIDPAAETADRLRRLQRDPAVNIDSGQLQDASVAIQTGTPLEEGVDSSGSEAIFDLETADEMGESGDTEVFDIGDDFDDFDVDFDDDFDDSDIPDPGAGFDDDVDEPDDFDAESDDLDDAFDDDAEFETVVGSPDDSAADDGSSDDADDIETVIEPSGGADEDEFDDDAEFETVIAPSDEEDSAADEEFDDDAEFETVIAPSDDGDDTEEFEDDAEFETVIAPSDEGDSADDENFDDDAEFETVIAPSDDEDSADDAAFDDDDAEFETVIAPSDGDDSAADEDEFDDDAEFETVIAPSDDDSAADEEDFDDDAEFETVIEPSGGPDEEEFDDDAEFETVIAPSDDGESADDGFDDDAEFETVIEPSDDGDDTEGEDE